MSVVANIRYPQKTVERTDYGPVFSGMVPAVLLAAIMIKFSAISAPGLRIQVSAWTFSMLVCWFALAKGVFLHAHRGQTAEGRAAANQAFAIWIRSRAGRCAGFAACTLAVAAGCDLALRYNAAMSPDAVARAIAGFFAIVWFLLGPSFVVMCAVCATREDFGFGESLELTRGIFSRAGPPWLGVMLALFGVVKITGLLYDPLRSIVVSILPSIVTVYVYSVAFHMAVLMALIVIQAIYASWIAPRLSASTPAGGWDAMTPDRISRRMRPVGDERADGAEAPTPAAIDRALRRRNSGADS